MSSSAPHPFFVAIACGGTGGHLFPGIAIAEQLQKHGCQVKLLISPKEVDQQAVKSVRGMEIYTLPAVALQNRNYFSFVHSFWQSWRAAKKIFQARPPHAVLAMGGFTSAPPIFAGKGLGAKTFLHESNLIPGRANRLLARFVDRAFVGFKDAGQWFDTRSKTTTGTPVRPQFVPRDAAECRTALGLDPNRCVVLVMGGSQGASGLNNMILSTLPVLGERAFKWQWLHLTGAGDFEIVKRAYAAYGLRVVVRPFLNEMESALGAATVSVSRSGASSLAEIAAMRLPSLIVPYPAAADNHQLFNARAFENTGAAKLLEQGNASPVEVADVLNELVENETVRSKMQSALAQWHAPKAAEKIAAIILETIAHPEKNAQAKTINCACGHAHGPAMARALNP
jgi:UDP-N-acetylglucosamine--N-acetylmuramyl-(pentapeptide) pyrophosphoryl-undecaprenol N-acetylglucosamine transferase